MDILKIAFNTFPELETERFILREVKEQDYTEIYDIYCDEEAVRYQQIEPMTTMEQAQKSVVHFISSYENKKFIRWCISDKNYDKVVGLITLHDFDNWNSKAEIGYMLNKKYWRKNIMYEAGEKVIQYAFEVIGLHRIEALIHPENIASNRLSMKLGFKEEGLKKSSAYNRRTGEFEDRLIYGIINCKDI
ncbi:GNAT family N-acetyltransferase [Clostridium sp. C8-1-8]|uniref:GNAT family N-acetyltransferase n=1 Tax=Clostridium sp. C8-1-8 TaxID=2698831 RepID=UPI001371F63E|nr:GNAT family N-acetyltransferase [Clostridium sp. C8-1-8]